MYLNFMRKRPYLYLVFWAAQKRVGKGSQLRCRLWKPSGEPPETVYKIWGLGYFSEEKLYIFHEFFQQIKDPKKGYALLVRATVQNTV